MSFFPISALLFNLKKYSEKCTTFLKFHKSANNQAKYFKLKEITFKVKKF